jgi:MATE family multidrug resistance protein
MISAFASLMMIFTDRLFLARYSLDALNASVNAGTLAWALMGGVGMITAMSEIFVAQYNGAGLEKKIGVPVWQMIWFALFSYAIFLPLSIGAPYVFTGDPNADLEAVYFRWLMLFGPSYAMMTAFGGFLIGRGKTKILILLSLIANILNTTLDWLFIFGLPPYIPEMGIKGAAIATCLGYVFQTVMLALIFFKSKNREAFGTNRWKLNLPEFRKCLRVGFPQGVFYGLEIFGWAVFYWLMTSLSVTHITISSICQSLIILFSFFFDGLTKGVATVAGNFIGSKRISLVYYTLRSALMMQMVFSIGIAFLFFVSPKGLIRLLFFDHFDSIPTDNGLDPIMMETLRLCMAFAFIYIFFEGIRWIFSGLLSAAGDTLFLLIAGSLTVWIALLLPVYVIVVRQALSVEYAWALAFIYSLIACLIYGLRLKQGAWKKIDLVSRK